MRYPSKRYFDVEVLLPSVTQEGKTERGLQIGLTLAVFAEFNVEIASPLSMDFRNLATRTVSLHLTAYTNAF